MNNPQPFGGAVDGPYQDGFAVTPSDTVDFGTLASALFIGTGGQVVLITEKGTQLTFGNVPSGTTMRIRCRRVNQTNTAASNIVALF